MRWTSTFPETTTKVGQHFSLTLLWKLARTSRETVELLHYHYHSRYRRPLTLSIFDGVCV